MIKKMKRVKKLPAFFKQTKRCELRASKNQAFILGKKIIKQISRL